MLPMYSTVWVALTEATPANGCMFVVPAKWDKNYYKTGEGRAEFDHQVIHTHTKKKNSKESNIYYLIIYNIILLSINRQIIPLHFYHLLLTYY